MSRDAVRAGGCDERVCAAAYGISRLFEYADASKMTAAFDSFMPRPGRQWSFSPRRHEAAVQKKNVGFSQK
jgi:hypothetical protein